MMKILKKIVKKLLGYDKPPVIPNLDGDRAIEWTWIIQRLPSAKRVLDIGCCYSIISAMAARLGNAVTGVDLNDELSYKMANLKFVRGSVNELSWPESFDCVVLASTVEHIGLSGRYNSAADESGDLTAMAKIRSLLKPQGELLITIPVGRDAVFSPFHRVYGPQRLPQLLAGYQILEEEYWIKKDQKNWEKCGKDEALRENSSAVYYGLGLFRLASA